MGENQRNTDRYRTALQVELEGGIGVTRDLSVSGIYFETGLHLAVGQSINFTIMFDDSLLGESKRIKCQGEIVRVDEIGPKIGVAAMFHSYSFNNSTH